ncbi:hypothetical protein JCM11251_007509 [Rhodosporidiobolus azoricus]
MSFPSSAEFNKLPVELLKRIVELVKAQDDVIKRMAIDRAAYPRETLEGMVDDEVDADGGVDGDTAGGNWRAAYGRGVGALSRVNTTLRALTLPHLFETVCVAQLDHIIFRSYILGRPTAAHIKHVNLGTGLDRLWISAAWTFQHLPSVTSATIRGSGKINLLSPPVQLDRQELGRPDLVARETARLQVHDFLRRIATLHLHHVTWTMATDTLGSQLFWSGLRRLKIGYAHLDSLRTTRLPQVLQTLPLEELVIEQDFKTASRESLRSLLCLPSLTSFVVPVKALGDDPLSLIAQIAPNVISLQLFQTQCMPHDAPPSSLPHLKHLMLEGLSAGVCLVPLFSASPLQFVELRTVGDEMNDCGRRPAPGRWPSSLRSLHWAVSSCVRPIEIQSFVSQLRSTFGMDVSFIWRPMTWAYDPDNLAPIKKKADALRDDLRWALSE